MTRRLVPAIAAVTMVLLVTAGCGKKTTATTNAGATTAPPTPAVSGGGGGGEDYGSGGYGHYGGSSSGTSKSGGSTVQAGAGGFVFSPSKLSVAKGSSITVKNVGSASHTFTISGKGIDVVLDPGASKKVAIDLAPGTYTFICRFHVSLGMKGTLTVTG